MYDFPADRPLFLAERQMLPFVALVYIAPFAPLLPFYLFAQMRRFTFGSGCVVDLEVSS